MLHLVCFESFELGETIENFVHPSHRFLSRLLSFFQLDAKVRALKLPEQLELEREEDEAAAAAAALEARRAAQDLERQRRLSEMRRRDAVRRALARVSTPSLSASDVKKDGPDSSKSSKTPAPEALGKKFTGPGRELLRRAQEAVGSDPVVVTLFRWVLVYLRISR
jgi:hypothetical protein